MHLFAEDRERSVEDEIEGRDRADDLKLQDKDQDHSCKEARHNRKWLAPIPRAGK
jgi:hypothetical protein